MQITDIHTHVIPLKRRRWQIEAAQLSTKTRFFVGVGHRGIGKTAHLANKAGRFINTNNNRTLIFVSPTFGMGMKSWWGEMEKLFGQMPGMVGNKEYYYWLNQYTNSRVWLTSFDTPDRMRGLHGDVLMDEAQMATTSDVMSIVWPMIHNAYLADPTSGRFEAYGTASDGNNVLYDGVKWSREHLKDWSHHIWDVYHAGVFDDDYIEQTIKPTMSADQFAREYLCHFQTDTTSLVFKNFSEANLDDTDYLGGTIEVGMDFNVTPMTAVLAVKLANRLHIFDEISLDNSNTEEMCEEIRNRYPKANIVVSPDQSGRNRSTSSRISMQTDHQVLRSYGFRVNRRAQGNPPVLPSIREVNSLLCDATGRRRLTVHPRCEHLREGLMRTRFKPGTSLVDKSKVWTHIMDALRYLVHFHSKFTGRTTASVQEMVL